MSSSELGGSVRRQKYVKNDESCITTWTLHGTCIRCANKDFQGGGLHATSSSIYAQHQLVDGLRFTFYISHRQAFQIDTISVTCG